MKEEWRDVVGYEGMYLVSNLGKVVGVDRLNSRGYKIKGRVMGIHPSARGRYVAVVLTKNSVRKGIDLHKVVAQAFLNHTPNGMDEVVHHKDNDTRNNRADNLIVTDQRSNCHTHFNGTSDYKGVCWDKRNSKWLSQIYMNGSRQRLGLFSDEYDAHLAYQKALKQVI